MVQVVAGHGLFFLDFGTHAALLRKFFHDHVLALFFEIFFVLLHLCFFLSKFIYDAGGAGQLDLLFVFFLLVDFFRMFVPEHAHLGDFRAPAG